MTTVSLDTAWTAPATFRRPGWLAVLVHHAEVLRRRARRDRYLKIIGHLPARYDWVGEMSRAMGGRH